VSDNEDAVPYVYRPPAQPETGWEPAAYPRPTRVRRPEEAPEGLTGRKARRWKRQQVKLARREQRVELAGAVDSWKIRDPEQVRPLGVVLLVVAVIVAGLVFLWPERSPEQVISDVMATTTAPALPAPDSSTPSSAASSTTSSAAPAPAPTSATTTASTSSAAPAELDGSDVEGVPTKPAELPGPAGDVTYAFLLGYNTYNPAFPDPLDTWTAGWSEYATPDLVDAAPAAADRLWSFTVASSVAPAAERVRDCVQTTADSSSFTYDCTVDRILQPIGGGVGANHTVDTTRWSITVTDTDTDNPRVLAAEQRLITEPVPGA